jgi:peptidoglycan/xylan/chitin deacetylase (PgdA/CDA1 family)
MNSFSSLYSNSGQYDNHWRDRYERDRYYNSFSEKIFEPVLSRQILKNGFIPHYPQGRKFAVCISHDIDHLYHQETSRRKLVNVAKSLTRGNLKKAYSGARSIFKEEIYPEFNLDRLINLNNSFDIKSSYYFLSLNPEDEDYAYNLDNIREQLQLVLAADGEIGLHGGHRAYNEMDKLLSEKAKLENCLGASVKGYRNHYLRFRAPLTWHNLSKAGFLYDTTYGYADCAGFRNGMCYPFFPYDDNNKEFIDIIELPLIMMDATLFYYMRFDEAGSVRLCRRLVEEVAECGGVFTLLWHNNSLSGEMGETYKRILQVLSEYDPWFTTSAGLIEWWKKEGLLDQSHRIVQKLLNS